METFSEACDDALELNATLSHRGRGSGGKDAILKVQQEHEEKMSAPLVKFRSRKVMTCGSIETTMHAHHMEFVYEK